MKNAKLYELKFTTEVKYSPSDLLLPKTAHNKQHLDHEKLLLVNTHKEYLATFLQFVLSSLYRRALHSITYFRFHEEKKNDDTFQTLRIQAAD
jgi:hypothetical protein